MSGCHKGLVVLEGFCAAGELNPYAVTTTVQMGPSKLRTICFFFNVALSLAGSIAALMLTHHFVSILLGREPATVFVIVVKTGML
jgi:hypothetical protein